MTEQQRICNWCNNEIFADGGGDDLVIVDGNWYHKNFCVPPIPAPYICAQCKEPLVQDKFGAFDNILSVHLVGGYGQFIDHLSRQEEENYHFYLCHECAHDLCAKNVWLDNIIKPAKSHSHKQEYHEQHPDHVGWDYHD